MAYARRASTTKRRRPARRRLTRLNRGRYTTRGSYSRTPTRRVARRAVPRTISFNAYALAHVDPFDDRCKGIKIPDANTMPSVALTLTQETTVSVTGGFANAHAFQPVPAAQEVFAAVKNVGSNSWQWGTSATSVALTAAQQVESLKLGALITGYDLYRPVAHGIRVSCGLSPQTVTGFLHVAIVARPKLNRFVNDWWPASVGDLSESVWYKRVPLATLTQRPLTVVNKVLDTTSNNYLSPVRAITGETVTQGGVNYGTASTNDGGNPAVGNASTTSTFDRDSLNGFATIVIAVEGAPLDSAPIVVEQIMHLEAIPKSVGLQTGGLASPSRPDVLAGVSHMAATTPAEHFEGDEPSRIQQAAQAFATGAQQAMGGTLNTMADSFVSAAGRAGYAATMYAVNRAAGAAFGDVPGVGPANRLMNG